jgi:hypothetical protein
MFRFILGIPSIRSIQRGAPQVWRLGSMRVGFFRGIRLGECLISLLVASRRSSAFMPVA